MMVVLSPISGTQDVEAVYEIEEARCFRETYRHTYACLQRISLAMTRTQEQTFTSANAIRPAPTLWLCAVHAPAGVMTHDHMRMRACVN